jgi:glutaredoxin-like protein
MLQNKEGQRVPSITFLTRENGKRKEVASDKIFAGKKVVAFSLPGAFTPTCSTTHVPRFNELAQAIKARGIDDIVCISVNDPFVMAEWAKDQAAPHVNFLPDGNGEFTEKMGMLVDKRAAGLGQRSWRYSMLVEDGVIKKMFIEPEKDGDPFEVSDADTMLRFLDPNAKAPHDVLLFTKPGCGFCTKAKALLDERGWSYDEVPSTPRRLRAASGKSTTPQVFIDGRWIGGADELETFLATEPR